MMNTKQLPREMAADDDVAADNFIAPVPRISVHAFCESDAVAAAVGFAKSDRRLTKAQVKVKMGGIPAAIEFYDTTPTPNLILLECKADIESLNQLDELSSVCDAGTRVILISSGNDGLPYRELVRRGVNDHIILPIDGLKVVRAICNLFSSPGATPKGRVIAVVGAKGGVGASTIAHNIAWSASSEMDTECTVLDLDLAFGTAGLNYDQDPMQGIAEAVFSTDKPDTALVERLLAQCSDRLNLLAAPANLDRVYDFGADAFDSIYDTLRLVTPCAVLDVPHQWSGWTRRTLVNADEILIVAEPDLANLRNTKNLLSLLAAARPNDRPPNYCLNQVGMYKRPEIDVSEFVDTLKQEPIAVIPFDSRTFVEAANNGYMISQFSEGHRAAKLFAQMAGHLLGHKHEEPSKGSLLTPILKKIFD